MAFIGNTNTTQAFTPAIDYFSGTGSATAFTLSRPVASVAQVQVTIDNVAQNPSSAYTVSSNTITFTSAPLSGTNNIYVYYTSPITQVIAPGQGTVTTTSFVSSTGTGAGVFQTSPTITTPVISSLSSASATALTLQSAGTTAITVDTSQNVLVGTTTTTNNLRNGEKVAVVTTGGNQGGASLTTYSGTGAGNGVILDIQRSRGTTDGSMTAVASGDTLGYLLFRGSDGTSFQDSSYITGQVDGAVSGGTVPGRLGFITSGTERMRLNSSGTVILQGGSTSATGVGIAFPATQSASSDANTLDDYEEGTWTPSLGGNTTYVAQVGAYTKIGRFVCATFEVNVSSIGTGSSTTISGLPFTSFSTPTNGMGGMVGYFTGGANSVVMITLRIDLGSTSFGVASIASAATGMNAGLAFFANGTRILGSICYFTA
jgi:hypothetical protein